MLAEVTKLNSHIIISTGSLVEEIKNHYLKKKRKEKFLFYTVSLSTPDVNIE